MATNRIYYRCSTNSQEFTQQQKCVLGYFERSGISADGVEVIQEHVSGSIGHDKRELGQLLQRCGKGDIIYVSELSRLGRSMRDVLNIVEEAREHGVTIIQCKDGTVIEGESLTGKVILFALSLAAEIELENIKQRTQMGLDARRQQLEQNGYFISKNGRICTKLGERIMSSAEYSERRSIRAADSASKWRENSIGYQWVKRQFQRGVPRKQILAEFNHKFEQGEYGFCTRNGKKLNDVTLGLWRREMAI